MSELLLTSRALDDLQNIYDYSVNEWGETTASEYMLAFEDAFSLLGENKGLLKTNRKISSRFMVYYVRQHCVICDVVDDTIFVLTVRHTSMNLLERLKELEPNLEDELKALHKKLRS